MAVIKTVENQPGTLILRCPGCKSYHQIWTGNGPGPRWQFNGSFDRPTFTPSLLVTTRLSDPPVTSENLEEWKRNPWPQTKVNSICHSFIREGYWEFLTDCTHELAGQRVPMVPVE